MVQEEREWKISVRFRASPRAHVMVWKESVRFRFVCLTVHVIFARVEEPSVLFCYIVLLHVIAALSGK